MRQRHTACKHVTHFFRKPCVRLYTSTHIISSETGNTFTFCKCTYKGGLKLGSKIGKKKPVAPNIHPQFVPENYLPPIFDPDTQNSEPNFIYITFSIFWGKMAFGSNFVPTWINIKMFVSLPAFTKAGLLC